MKSSSFIAAVAFITLLTVTYCSKTPEKPVQETQLVTFPKNNVETNSDVKVDSIRSGEDSLALQIKDYINTQFLKTEDLRAIGQSERKFNFYQIDLNNDGKREIFINFFTPYFCGSGGCSLVLLDHNLKLINKFTVTRTPITVDSKTENGWKVLWLKDGNSWKILTHKNGKYPSNPSLITVTKEAPDSNNVKLFEGHTSKEYPF